MSKRTLHLFNQIQIELSEDGFNTDAEFEILTSDKQYDSRYGNFSYSKKDLEEMAMNFNSDVRGVEIAVDLNHDREKKAYAWIKPGSMKVKESGKLGGQYSLYCQLYRYTPEGEELMKTGAYRYFSVEIMLKWKRFKDGAKKIYKNVIFGLALTNSPVIKDMKPTFSEGDNLQLNHTNDMETFKIFLGSLAAKEIVTLSEKETLNDMFAVLSEEEKKEFADDMEKVAGKPEEKEETEEERKKREAVEKKKKEEAGKLSEVQQELSEKSQRLSVVEAKLRTNELSEAAEAFVLSQNTSTGFVRKDKEAVVDFMLSLSEDQVEEFKKVLSLVRYAQLGEEGDDNGKEKDEDSKEGEAEELAEKLLSENPKLERWEALDKAYARLDLKG